MGNCLFDFHQHTFDWPFAGDGPQAHSNTDWYCLFEKKSCKLAREFPMVVGDHNV